MHQDKFIDVGKVKTRFWEAGHAGSTVLLLVDPAGMARRGTLFDFGLATLPCLGEILTWPGCQGPNPHSSRPCAGLSMFKGFARQGWLSSTRRLGSGGGLSL